MRPFFLALLLTLSLSTLAFGQEPLSSPNGVKNLREAYLNAVKSNERIGTGEAAVRQAQGFYESVRGNALPEISFRYASFLQDNDSETNTGMFRVSKTDLSFFGEYAEIRAGRSTVTEKTLDLNRIHQLLLRDVALAFYGLLQSEENVVTTVNLSDLAEKRLTELSDRVKIGRTRKADAIGLEVQIRGLRSQLEESTRQVDERRDILAYLVGASVGEISADEPLSGVELPSLSEYLKKIEQRPDVAAARANVQAEKYYVDAARSDYFPQFGVTANEYTDGLGSDNPGDWDVALSVSLPLWDWKDRSGALKTARATLSASELNLSAARRAAELEIRTAYRNLVSARKQLEIKGEAVDLARQDYEIQAADDRQGLVTSIEVLESLNRLNTAELELNQSRLVERLSAINLQITSGASPEDILQ